MIIDAFPFKYNHFTSGDEQATKLKEMIHRINTQTETVNTKFMIIYEEKYDFEDKIDRGIVYADYDICRDEIIFDNDFDEGQKFKFLYLWMLPESVPSYAEIDALYLMKH